MPYNPYGNLGYLPNIQSGTSGYSGVSEVSSIDEVKAASVLYGVGLFMDRTNNLFYAKNSQGLIKAFEYKEIQIPSNNPQNFVSRAEFNELKEKYDELVRQHATEPTAATQPNVNADQQWQPATNDTVSTTATQYDTGASNTGVLQQGGTNEFDQGTGQPIA